MIKKDVGKEGEFTSGASDSCNENWLRAEGDHPCDGRHGGYKDAGQQGETTCVGVIHTLFLSKILGGSILAKPIWSAWVDARISGL
jgi:hypothetical protein